MMEPCTHKKEKHTLMLSYLNSCKKKKKEKCPSPIQTEKEAQGGVSTRLSCPLWGWTGLGPSGPAF